MNKLPGSGVTGSAADSNSAGSRSSLDSPAIYIDNETGREVPEDWWPGQPIPEIA